jgi:hypothetical protein
MLIAGLLLAAMVLLGMQVANAGEIVPSIGVSKPAHDADAETKPHLGLAFRSNLLPLLKTEVGVAYRSESYMNDQLRVRQWPLTASLWLSPVPMLYAGGGAGWYHTTYDFQDTLLGEDSTDQQFGVHAGGGLQIPLGPVAADLNGRYIFFQEEPAIPTGIADADYWSVALGLAIKL